ncbi:hypothetical protein AG1IA_05174 [Rhizoctonia solani AG-1 IA]|uniref:Uncharacterized protein n=1 Tax=Thanatephorus cucumeris (strain AG1-IA) TaxID=983506 RepID=L8WVI6_THACA|nr:hypothetical protein AG1IA_05174 [Rhizoctonia solani AG-1 IA]
MCQTQQCLKLALELSSFKAPPLGPMRRVCLALFKRDITELRSFYSNLVDRNGPGELRL